MRGRQSSFLSLHLSTLSPFVVFKEWVFYDFMLLWFMFIVNLPLFLLLYWWSQPSNVIYCPHPLQLFETITSMCILQSVSFGTFRFGSAEKRVCLQSKLIKLSLWFLSDIISQYPTLWTEQVRSRQNNRTRAPCEFQRPLFFNDSNRVFANLNWKHTQCFSY